MSKANKAQDSDKTQPLTANKAKGGAIERLVDSQPILNMLDLLSNSGFKNFHEKGVWEVCLCALILKVHPTAKVQSIMEALPYHNNALDEADTLNTMAHLGYFSRPADCELEDIDDRLLPGLFIPGNGTPCIVLGRDKEGVLQFYDPVSKLVSTVPPSFDKEGKVWFFQPYDENRQSISKFMRKGSGHTWFRALLGRFKGTFAQIMVAGFILNVLALVTPLFIILVYDRVIAAGAVDVLPMLAFGAFLTVVFEAKLRDIRSRGLSWLAGRLDNIVGNKIFAHLIGLSPDLVEKASVAAQVARIKTFESVRDFFAGSVFLSLLEAPFVLISVLAVAIIAGPLVAVPLFMVTAYLVLFVWARKKVKTSIRLAAKASSARQQFTIETFEKLNGICGHGLSAKWQEKFRHLSGREMLSHFHLSWLGMVAETTAHTLTVLSAVATIGFGVGLIWAGDLTTGGLVATMILVWRILTPFYSLCTMVPRLEQLRNSVKQVNELMDIDTEAEEAKSYSRLPRIKGDIEFDNVSFKYSENGDPVFSHLSFQAKPGEMVVITGGNGNGKSSVLKLIKSLHRAETGTVLIDGFDIRQLDAPDLRRQVAYVPKSPMFFYGSIIENLRMANPTATEEDVEKALILSDAWKDVEKMKDGLNTKIGSHGGVNLTSNLSTRLSLARAYLNPASILLIDELPNTLLGDTAGKNLKEYLAENKGRRTVIMVSYRQDYMKLSDKIVWLQAGKSPTAGEREDMFELLNKETEGVA